MRTNMQRMQLKGEMNRISVTKNSENVLKFVFLVCENMLLFILNRLL